MGDLSLEKVSETYLDVLKEIGNIGAGNELRIKDNSTNTFSGNKNNRTV